MRQVLKPQKIGYFLHTDVRMDGLALRLQNDLLLDEMACSETRYFFDLPVQVIRGNKKF